MITSIAYTVYPVTDMAKARGFYETALGLKVTHNFKDLWLEYDLGDSTLAIAGMDMGLSPGAKGAMVALETDDLDGLVKQLKARLVSFAMEPFETPVCRMGIIKDPDGNQLVLHQRHQAGV